MKKIVSLLALMSLFFTTNFGFTQTFAVETNSQAEPWTMQKARHLAKRALFGVTKEQVQQLYDVGSAQNAVNVLFPSRNGPNKNDYNNQLNTITSDPSFDPNNSNDMYEYYLAKKLYDPYEAKAKLFLMFEDIFSVNTSGSKNITFMDIENTHELIYQEMFGDYKTLVKKSLYNNGGTGDYSISQFLDLLNQSNPARPNENYARELVQLLLMGEYLPGDSLENGDERNYSETDVAALAKILVGFEVNENTHQVTFNPAVNTNQTIEFLDGELPNNVSYPFYDTQSGEVDVQILKNSIGGNNGLPDNTIDYIFAKRSNAISLFLADKLYNFYISENPTREELDEISTQLLQNNFDMYTTTKWLLSNDMMYSEKSMNELRYKNPVELVVGVKKLLNIQDPETFRHSLGNIGWRPYFPGSIFGRDGFDENKEFFNATSVIEWSYEVSKIINQVDYNGLLDENLSLEENITLLENKLLTDEILSQETRDKLIKFMTEDENGTAVVFNPTDETYNRYYTHGLLYFILTQPEFILNSGIDLPSSNNQGNESFYGNDNKLVIIKFRGGFDWLHGVIPKDEYSQYLENRGVGALAQNELLEIGDYYINAKMSDFKDLYDSGDLKIFNRVGTPKHSRAHDTASQMMASAYNQGSLEAPGILGEFIKNENPLKTVQLGGDKGLVFRGGQYLTIGSNGLFRIQDSTNNDFRIHKLNTLKSIYNDRFYPENLDFVFKNGVYIGNVAENSVSNGGRSGAGYNMQDNLAFAENLFDGGVTNVVRIAADGGYDTHGRQKDNLSNNLERVASRTADFYNRIKDKHNVTIVLYSEFGRTLKINTSEGTDHGKGGGMFVLTNNSQFKSAVPEKVIGNNSFIDAQANRLGVGIDYRAIYKKIYETLYNKDISETLGGDFELSTYINDENPEPKLFRIEYQGEGSRLRAHIKFRIDDENYFHTQGSHIKFSYGSDQNNLREESRYTIDRYMVDSDKELKLYMRNISPDTQYFYKIEIFDNQYNSTTINGDFTTPERKSGNDRELRKNKNTFLSQYNNTNISNSLILQNPIELSGTGSSVFGDDPDYTLETSSGTTIDELYGSSGSIWNGGFIIPQEINKDKFITKISKLDNANINKLNNIEKIIKVGSDSLGVGMKLNKPVKLSIKNIDSNKRYGVITTQDGINWTRINQSNISQSGNTINIQTNHFSYFALVEMNNNGEIIQEDNNSDGDGNTDNGNNNSNNSNKGGSSGSSAPKKDVCLYGDYSKSYYDRACGKTYNSSQIYKLAHSYEFRNNISYNIENDLINNALEELETFDNKKYKIFFEIFNNIDAKNSDQKDVLKFLREDVTTMKVGGYDIYYIQSGNKNETFKKLVSALINRKYNSDIEKEVIESVNDFILAYSIRTDENFSSFVRTSAGKTLKIKLASLKFHVKKAESSKKSKKQVLQKNNVQTNSSNQKTEAYYRTRKEEILNKHKQKN